ncbi:MAG: hypothetical protein ABSB74_16345 [Tepidisphaeraceae bacterium]
MANLRTDLLFRIVHLLGFACLPAFAFAGRRFRPLAVLRGQRADCPIQSPELSKNPRYNRRMPKTPKREIPDIRVPDGAAALHKLEDFTRRILAVPKKEIDGRLARERSAKKKRR